MIKLPDVRITAAYMAKIGTVAANLAIIDAKNGIMQDNTANHAYRSKQYAKYKANAMKRFARTTSQSKRKPGEQLASDIFTRGKITGNTGKLKGFEGRAINTDVSKVNLRLTGDMLATLRVIKSDANYCRVSFAPEQAAKVLGNIRNGYNPVGLNNKNASEVKRMIIERLNSQKPKGTFNYTIGK